MFKKNKTSDKKLYKDSDFTIEFYPETKVYMPKYKDKFLDSEYGTGIITTRSGMPLLCLGRYDLKEFAESRIRLYKEQQFKENVIVLKPK